MVSVQERHGSWHTIIQGMCVCSVVRIFGYAVMQIQYPFCLAWILSTKKAGHTGLDAVARDGAVG
ncbi:hypothetical protein P691DRAFT_800950 [Macrolepiota fuliginosa MF-IS2]|uniref:Uncharacterized protein n=1 Tax=Macrolepiota fuliginosa MF-IS2 TaxID=1400762 RepID=A0A9P5XFH4_9AGAR|nr:hypothetical protein P691DRAFT_800950 [Macrolepiota fuliginosa MF-IS2]